MEEAKQQHTLLIPGFEDKAKTGQRVDLGEFNILSAQVVGSYRMDQTRAVSNEPVKRQIAADEIIELELQDGIKLYLSSESYLDLTQHPNNQVSSEAVLAPTHLELDDPSRGLKDFFIKSISFLKVLLSTDDIVDQTAIGIARVIEDKLTFGPGLYRCGVDQFGLVEVPHKIPTNRPILLFIHGTASSTESSFGDLWDGDQNALWHEFATQTYGKHIYAFEHRTLTESPIDNAIQLLEALPHGARIHLVTHSRGGLIGELLCRGQIPAGESPISEEMLGLFEPGSDDTGQRRQAIKQQREALVALNDLLKNKRLKIERYIRVACPARGTTLASRRLDLYFSVILNTLSLIPGLLTSPTYQLIKSFLLAVAKQRTQPEDLPGLEAMMPTSRLIQIINWPRPASAADLSVIAGDIEIGGLFNSLAVIATNLFYLEKHDLVVNTEAMVSDAPRENGIRLFFHQGPEVCHFNYFNNLASVQKIISGLKRADNSEGGFETVVPFTQERLRGFTEKPIDVNAPVVYLLPGLFGSHLGIGDNQIWMDFSALVDGRFAELNINQKGVKAEQLHEETYFELIDYLSETHRVIAFPIDWRLSLFESAKVLANDLRQRLKDTHDNPVPIRILAHSQGGLIARAMIAEYPDLWTEICQRENSRLVLLGSPNRGCYTVARLLLGQERLLRLLSLLDFRHDITSILKVLVGFPGLLEMLPESSENSELDLFDIDTWIQIQKNASGKFVIPSERDLVNALKNRRRLDEQLQSGNELFFHDHISCIAGHDVSTPSAFSFEKSKEGFEIKFLYTAQGDGCVTWRSGQMAKVKTWYTQVKHGDLPTRRELFPAFLDILESNQTFQLSDHPVTTGNRYLSPSPRADEILLYPDFRDLSEAAFLKSRQLATIAQTPTQLEVNVTHGDLRYAKYSVAVGHYQDDQIVSAEEALNQKINGRLSTSFKLGLYPGDIATAKSFLHIETASDNKKLLGAIVIGLGNRGTLTAAQLETTVTHAMLDYIRTVYEQQLADQPELGVSFLLISTRIGGLIKDDALSAILRGILKANEALNKHTFDSLRIKKVEFIEIYLDRAVRAMRSLYRICSNEEFKLPIRLNQFVQSGKNGRERIPHHHSRTIWQRLQVTSGKDGELHYTYLTERARADATLIYTQRRLVENFINQSTASRQSEQGLATCLFELLVPNDFKHNAPHQDDILLILDTETAHYPWELLQQKLDKNTLPMAVRAGMIRQLIIDNNYSRHNGIFRGPNNALVVGDPVTGLNKFPPLSGASKEAFTVTEKLAHNGEYFVETRIEKNAGDIIKALYAKPYRILHLAGHGVYQYDYPETQAIEKITGMVLSDGIFLTPIEIKQMSCIPELVFINCCYLGYIENHQTPQFSTDLKPHLLAANLAIQFIKEGVRCVVAAGWEVHDPAAKLFAEVFYDQMLAPNNASFGIAVLKARKKVYQQFPGINTWGAYQCYGDPHFRLNPESDVSTGKQLTKTWKQHNWPEFSAPKELVLKLKDLEKEAAQISSTKSKQELALYLQGLINQIPKHWFQKGELNSAIAAVWSSLGEYDKALSYYEQAMHSDTANLPFHIVDQMCEIRIKQINRNLEKNLIIDEVPLATLEVAREQLTHLNAIVHSKNRQRLLLLLNKSIGNIYSRLGEIYKHKAMKKNETHRLHAIDQMMKYYHKAYEHSKNCLDNEDAHALLQWQMAAVVKNWRSRKNQLEDAEKILAIAEQLIEKQIASSKDLQHLIDKSDCQLVLALAKDSNSKDKNNLGGNINSIVDNYVQAIKQANTENISKTFESIQFLLELSKNRRTKIAQIARKNLLDLHDKLKAILP